MILPALVCVSVCVCVSVTTIRKEDQAHVSLRWVEGCGSNGQKTP